RAVNADYELLGQPSVSLEDIRRFRRIDSNAPGHPEYHWVAGVETTTGPLGQGVATSVGMAIARKWLADRYNRPGFAIFDYDIYAVCGDGCLMEGVASEGASLAGHLGLDNLCWIYDNNHITIEGQTSLAFTEDVATRFLAYRAAYPELASEIDQMQRRDLPAGWDRNLPVFPADAKGLAGRDASGKVLNALAQNIPWFLGGSADLGPSNKTTLTYEGAGSFQAGNPGGKNLHFGIREHAMAAIVNGLSLSKLRAFGASFFIFSDYAPAAGVARGAYVLADPPGGNPEVIVIASGSELSLAVEAHGKLLAEGVRARVVSMPSWEIFDHQTQEYRDSVLPPTVKARV